jgi:phosphatidylinositol alpha-1,6-mannosyltransferase
MKILAVSEVFPPRHGGSGRWLYELYRRLPAGAVTVVAHDEPDAAAFDHAQPLDIRRTPLRRSNWGLLSLRALRAHWRSVSAVRRIRAEVRPQVIHAGKALPEGLIASAASSRDCPYWCFVHGEELTLAKTSRELTYWTRRVLSRADRLVANSRNTAGMLSSDWSVHTDRISVLEPGVDTACFVPAHDAAGRRELGWQDRLVLLTVGGLQQRKGQDMLLRALPAIRREVPDVLYSMVGDGPARRDLEEIVRDLDLGGHVEFRTAATDEQLVPFYQHCDVFVLANRTVGWDFEGFGIVLLEAQACARPVVTGLTGGTGEAIDAPWTGERIDCSSPVELERTLISLLRDTDRRQRMGQAGRAWVVERFDWQRAAARAESLFAEAQSPSGY